MKNNMPPKLIVIAILLVVIIFGAARSAALNQMVFMPETQQPAPMQRVTISRSNYVYDCLGGSVPGVTVNGSNVTVQNCVISGWSGTGIDVSGNNNTFENLTINDGELASGDKDGIRFFGKGHTFKNIKITINTCGSPAHCDGVQTFGLNSGSDALFDGMEIRNFTIYQDGTSYMKGQCFMFEYGAHDITIKNSVLNCYRGVNLGDSRYPATNNITITNNTFVGKIPPPVESVLEWGVFVTNGENTTVQKNIFYNVVGEHLVENITAGYNLVYRTDGGRIYEPIYSTDKLTDPLLNAMYHPLVDSSICGLGWGAYPCASGGLTATPTVP